MYGGYETGASQFGGGGFMPSPANAHNTSSSPSRGKSNGDVQTLRALTVRQLYEGTLNSSDDQYKIDGEDLHNITLVGKLVQVGEQPTCLTFKLDDGTGKIDLSLWVTDDEQDLMAQRRADWRVGNYVRVHGHLRNFDNKKNIVIFSMRVIHDYNEVTYHFLQCIFQHVHLTKGGAGQGAGMTASKPNASGAGGGGFMGGAGTSTDDGVTAGMDPVQKDAHRIFNTQEAHNSDNGVSLDQVIAQLSGKYSVPAIRQAVEWLAQEGHLYTTSDDTVFKSTAA